MSATHLSDESGPSIRRRDLSRQLRIACATAHGFGADMSLNELVAEILERGLPSREERERIKASIGGDTAVSSSSS